MLGPLREHETVPPGLNGCSDVTADLPRTLLIFDESPEYGLNAYLLVVGLFMAGGVRDKNLLNPEVLVMVRRHPISLRSAIHRDEPFEMISPVGGRCQAEPMTYWHFTHDALKSDRGDVMTLVDDD